ncbi:aspartyl-phosphate phosphatase Spo0E family protein [Bacillus sp. JJ1532]|uniref:aspartyl-phosphate phosphatase Spo0E family protein n=1 Tax=unclassified Bacillus (in: firmicutes) TaxID=185979 RepID=UPI002FFFCFC9
MYVLKLFYFEIQAVINRYIQKQKRGGLMCDCKLLKDIEDCRREMIYLASSSSLCSQQVVDMSTKLDRLLNLYYTQNKKN